MESKNNEWIWKKLQNFYLWMQVATFFSGALLLFTGLPTWTLLGIVSILLGCIWIYCLTVQPKNQKQEKTQLIFRKILALTLIIPIIICLMPLFSGIFFTEGLSFSLLIIILIFGSISVQQPIVVNILTKPEIKLNGAKKVLLIFGIAFDIFYSLLILFYLGIFSIISFDSAILIFLGFMSIIIFQLLGFLLKIHRIKKRTQLYPQNEEKKISSNYENLKYCSKCGGKINLEGFFCGYCGIQLNSLMFDNFQ